MSSLSEASGFFSHPGKKLEDHLLNVARLTAETVRESFGKAADIADPEVIQQVAYLIGLCHDLGKTSAYFQEHLKGKPSSKKSQHALLSALAAYYTVRSYLGKLDLCEDAKVYLLTSSFCLVRQHHGDLRDFLDLMSNDVVNQADLLRDQVSSIHEEEFNKLVQVLGLTHVTLKGMLSWVDDFTESELLSLRSSYRRLRNRLSSDMSYYFLNNLLYSSLLDADKTDVVIGATPMRRSDVWLGDREFDAYRSSLSRTPLSGMRETCYQMAVEHFKELIRAPTLERIYHLNLPTGMGKTLIGLRLANMLRNYLYDYQGVAYRIIYVLPFINILEQNARVIENLLSLRVGSVSQDLMLIHHHLRDLTYTTQEEDYGGNEAELLIEGWNSEFIVTTFVQFFHTLVSNRNSMLRKFNKLGRSVIVLDEIQALPTKHWKLIKEVLTDALYFMDSYAIIMTATKPLVFEVGSEIKAVPEEIPSRYILDAQTYFDESTIGEFAEKLDLDELRYAFIVNTISEAEQLYDKLKERFSAEIGFLSSHVVPKQRLERIDAAKNGRFKVLVSTQIVEAGVDIDFDVVFRDIAPLDSLVQAAGRCNRSGVKENGRVYITRLREQNGHKFATYIYDQILVDITVKLIEGKRISEAEISRVFDNYQRELARRKDLEGYSTELIKALAELRYTGSPSPEEFKVIDQEYPQFDVFVSVDDDAERIFSEYRRIWNIADRFERKHAFDAIKGIFYQYVISVPKNITNLPPVDCGFLYVPLGNLDDFYDPVKGFLTRGKNPIW
ncbi:CRISPR-associated helicase Cas3' [Coprothermobacteraceae bacterium]|nr:CRISPR-associated helicase Cas3' [Coprothermobacteraceae bacterium]